MAVRYVDPNSTAGGDGTTTALAGANRAYASLAEWEAARQGTLTEVETVICLTNGGAADAASVTIDGWTTTAAFYVDVTVDPAYRHAGAWDVTKYRLENALASVKLLIHEDFTRVTGLQIGNGSTDGASGGLQGALTTLRGLRFLSNLVRSTVTATGLVGLSLPTNASSGPNYAVNNIVYGWTGGTGINLRSTSTSARTICYNNTIYNCATGTRVREDWCQCKNNLTIGCTDAWLLTNNPESGSTNNGYDEGADPATAGTNLAAFSDAQIFVDAATGDFHLAAGSPAINVGADLSADTHYAFSTDAAGQTRSAWDLGADEYVVVLGEALSVYLQEPVIGGCLF